MTAALPRTDRHPPARRRGTLYLAVLGVTMIVAMLALAGATVGRLELRRSTARSESTLARVLAEEAVEYGFNWMMTNPDWRKELASGVEHGPFYASGEGSFSFIATDADGDLADDEEGGFTLRGIGRAGDAVACEEVEVAFTGEPLDCLASALTVNHDISLPSGNLFAWKHIYGDGIVSVNGDIQTGASFSKIDCDAWATGTITGEVDGDADELQSPARTLPTSAVFDYYVANGAEIDINAIPKFGDKHELREVVLSAASNPYGVVSDKGIYVIDCEGEDLVIDTGRLVATVVLLNNGTGSRLEGKLCWEPPATGFPALLAANSLTMAVSLTGPDESADGVNYNPPGTPYNGGVDTDQSDDLDARLWGIFYCGGELKVDQYFGFQTKGAVVCERYELDSIVTHNYDASSFNTPPPGFRTDGELRIVPGSWRSVAY